MSGAVIIKDFEKVETFINNMDRTTGAMYQCQNGINSSYNRILDWNDKVFRLAGFALLDTGNKVVQLSEFLSKMLGILNAYCRNLNCEYAEYQDWNAQFHDRALEVQLNLEEELMRRAILGTTAEGIKSFERELERYIEATNENITNIMRELDDVRDYWMDDNFRTTEAHIILFRDEMQKNLSDLSELLSWIVVRRTKFEENEAFIQQMNHI